MQTLNQMPMNAQHNIHITRKKLYKNTAQIS